MNENKTKTLAQLICEGQERCSSTSFSFEIRGNNNIFSTNLGGFLNSNRVGLLTNKEKITKKDLAEQLRSMTWDNVSIISAVKFLKDHKYKSLLSLVPNKFSELETNNFCVCALIYLRTDDDPKIDIVQHPNGRNFNALLSVASGDTTLSCKISLHTLGLWSLNDLSTRNVISFLKANSRGRFLKSYLQVLTEQPAISPALRSSFNLVPATN